ncbi:MAG: glycine cleavage system aminomethyltransferase GcvT [Pseudomonadota bacterium]
MADVTEDLKRTPLHALHQELGGKMVPFAGYDMPVQYGLGVMKEHLHTRARAGLFDVSHMGQAILRHDDGYMAVAEAMERLVPVDLMDLADARQRYGLFTNDTGGILDDLMIARRGTEMFVVVNAACKDADVAHMRAGLGDVDVDVITDRALLALQGPVSEAVLTTLVPGVDAMRFMDVAILPSRFGEVWVSRSGYTGEDGFEISVAEEKAEALARALLNHADVEPIGLGARDSLRLEGGLCLYGHDIDTTTTPVEAGLTWAIQKIRRAGGARAGGFPGADRILEELENGSSRKRVGLRPEGRAPMREGTPLFASETSDATIGQITSGAFGPTIGGPVSMSYVPRELSTEGRQVFAELRGKRLPARVAHLPFTPANFKR